MDGYLVLLIQEKALLISKGWCITMLLSFIIFLNAKKMDFALTNVLILVKNRLFSQKTSQKILRKILSNQYRNRQVIFRTIWFSVFYERLLVPPPFVVRYAEGVTPVKSLNAFDIEDASGKPVSAAMSSNVILGSVC